MGHRSNVAGSIEDVAEADRKAAERSRRALEVRAAGRAGIFHKVRLDADRGPLHAPDRSEAASPAAAVTSVRALSRFERDEAKADLGRGRVVRALRQEELSCVPRQA